MDFSFLLSPPPHSLDKLLGAITTAAERNNRERFSPIVEGLENHEALQLQVSWFCLKLLLGFIFKVLILYDTQLVLNYHLNGMEHKNEILPIAWSFIKARSFRMTTCLKLGKGLLVTINMVFSK